MQCPICSVDLVMTERQGVEIDYCPKCRGIWLDRNELEKIIERSAAPIPLRGDERRSTESPYPRESYGRDHHDHNDHHDHDDDHNRGKRGRRGGLLGDLFDF